MTYRNISLALALSALVGGCTIITEPTTPPPPPPPPGGQTEVQPVAPTPTATAPTEPPRNPLAPNLNRSTVGKLTSKKTADKSGKPDQPQTTQANLIVQVVDGTCEIKIDEQSQGNAASAQVTVAAGQHVVSCTPEGGETQRYTVEVVEGGQPTTVIFSVKTGNAPRTVPLPPTGRPQTP